MIQHFGFYEKEEPVVGIYDVLKTHPGRYRKHESPTKTTFLKDFRIEKIISKATSKNLMKKEKQKPKLNELCSLNLMFFQYKRKLIVLNV